MILAKNSDALRYRGIHPDLDLALEHIRDDFLSSLGDTRVELRGSDVYCTKYSYTTIDDADSFFEAHKKYLDIQIMLEGRERVEVSSPDCLEEYDAKPERDVYYLRGPGEQSLVLSPGSFLVVFPDDAHKLKLHAEGSPAAVSKAVFKVRIDRR